MALDQATRTLNLNTPLGDNELLLTAFRGEESISRLFRFELDMISDNNAVAVADIVGKSVTFSVKLADESPRFFNGFVSRFFAGDEDEEHRRNYRAEVVPWLWFLARTTDCRIFQQKTVGQIIEQIFGDLGFSDYTLKLSGHHPQRVYCVQYRESDLNFFCRLCEEEGIFWFFTHEDGKHTLVIADNKGAYFDCPENEVDYPRDYGTRAIEDHITAWEHRYEFRTGKVAQTDYNFETPSTKLMTMEQTAVSLPGIDKYEYYDYPGLYGTTGDGQPLTRTRMEEEEVGYDVVEAASLCKTFTPGGKFKIRQHRSDSEEGKSYVVTFISHSASEPFPYETGAATDQEYRNSFTCIPDTVIFRPERITPKPLVQGPQTAVVVGPAGEEIFTDKYGRVKVQFFWDREGKKDENSSCWIRVAQNWAGKNWGIVFHPRIGQEVIVDFLEGDPDRPIITGRVYNAEQMPPYELPAKQTQSTIKTRSSKGGTSDNFNEIRFEDEKGKEQLFIHAEKNQDIEVENNETHWVGHDRAKTIDNDETTHVKHDRTETVDNNETITIHGNRTETVDKDEKITIHGNRTETVDKDETISIHANRTETVDKDEKITIQANRTESVGKNESVSIGDNRSHSIGKDQSLSIGKNETVSVGDNRSTTIGKNNALNVGKVLTVTAGDQISLTTGSASIVMKKDGTITISGKDITIKGTGKIFGKADKDMVLKGKNILQN